MGMAVYMMNGNHEKYPRRVVLHLEPTSFANIAARDFWYARYRQYIEFKWQRILDDIQSECSERLRRKRELQRRCYEGPISS